MTFISEDQILSSEHDPMGNAIIDYHRSGKASKLRVLSSMFDEDEIPVEYLFRTFSNMPILEQKALQMVSGKVLDIGAGAGCHSIYLQKMGVHVTALDISPLSCSVMLERGLEDVRCTNIFDERFVGKYDTILMLMNGIGIAGYLQQIPSLLSRLELLLNNEGKILFDSCDLRYVYEDDEGFFNKNTFDGYYGEVDYYMKYKRIVGNQFNWLYVDFDTIQKIALKCGWKCELVENGKHYDYLAKLTKI